MNQAAKTLRRAFSEDDLPKSHRTLCSVYPLEEARHQSSNAGIQEIIAKPRGELGRPSRGGYSLRDALAWEKKVYSDVQVMLLIFYMITC